MFSAPAASTSLPNIVYVMTDDQDMELGGLTPMPKVRKRLGEEGAVGEAFYIATPICCPSRASYLSGKYTHNHRTLQNNAPMGCSSAGWVAEKEPRAYAAFLGAANYTAAFFGKYLNAYGISPSEPLSYVPPGWSEWCGLQGNSRFYEYTLSVNGKPEKHGSDYHADYFTDLLHFLLER